MRIFYGAAHEQFPPSRLLAQMPLVEEAGFDGVYCSDHLQPWWEPGESGQAWFWLGAAAQATTQLVFGPAVTPAVARYHPVLVAQAFATFEELFPGRTFLAVGSGESLNESPLGFEWPDGETQLAMMDEALSLIRRLWDGETVDGKGTFFATKNAKLHTLPAKPPPLYVSAFHPGAAKVAARHGDGMWTLADPGSSPQLIEIYKAERERLGKDVGEIVLQASMSWGPDDDAALEGARVWKGAQPDEYYVDDWHDPQAMYEHAEATISDEQYKQQVIISADPAVHVERLQRVLELGPTTLAIMNCSGADPEGAIRVYGGHVLPALGG